MKEEWSIRKMREEQKKSQTKNTYKKSETFELKPKVQKVRENSPSVLTSFYQRLQLFLEE
jgi:hypothetical protein